MSTSRINKDSADEKRRSKLAKPKVLNLSDKDKILKMSEKFKNLTTPLILLSGENFNVYILGTNHAEPKCQEDTAFLIRNVKPKTVVLELCPTRGCPCKFHQNSIFQTRPQFTYTYLKKIMSVLGTIAGLIYFVDIYKEKHIADQVFFGYGGEMITGMVEGKAVNSDIVLGDRPMEITLKRQASVLDYWKKLQLILHVTLAMKINSLRSQLLLKASEMIFQDKKAFRVLSVERDIYLTLAIQNSAMKRYKDTPKTNVVAIVGQGHLAGILRFWGKVDSKILPFLLSTEPKF